MHDAATSAAGRALTREQFTAYAREQIATAGYELTAHRPERGVCSCGRALPCASALSLTGAMTHFRNRLDAVDRSSRPRHPGSADARRASPPSRKPAPRS